MRRSISPYADILFVRIDTGDTYFVARFTDYSVTFDDSWSPYAQARFTMPLDEALAAMIDPTAPDYVRAQVNMQRTAGTDDQSTTDDGWFVRSLTRNYVAGTMNVDLASAEAPAQQFVQTRLDPASAPLPLAWPAGTDLQFIINSVIDGRSAALFEDDPGFTYAVPEATQWDVGLSITEYLHPLVAPTGRKLICTPTGANGPWRLHVPGTPVDPPDPAYLAPVYDLDELIEYESRSSLESQFTDDVLVIYEWTDATNVDHRRVDRTSLDGSVAAAKFTVDRPDGPYPGPGAAVQLRDRLNLWRYERTFTALWDLYVRPGMDAGIRLPDGTVSLGQVQSVTYNGDGTMRVVQHSTTA